MEPLSVNPYFADFNLLETRDPRFNEHPHQARLLELIHDVRRGSTESLFAFADVMYCTLREQAFEDFQRTHGPMENSFREWFYEKLFQFFRILLYESIRVLGLENGTFVSKSTDFPVGKEFSITGFRDEIVQLEEIEQAIEQAIEPEHNAQRPWYELIRAVSEHGKDRLKAAEEWLARFRREHRRLPSSEGGWTKNQERDRVILNCLAREMARVEVCRQLDKLTIVTIPALQARGLHKWEDGWEDHDGRKAIQSLFSKLLARRV